MWLRIGVIDLRPFCQHPLYLLSDLNSFCGLALVLSSRSSRFCLAFFTKVYSLATMEMQQTHCCDRSTQETHRSLSVPDHLYVLPSAGITHFISVVNTVSFFASSYRQLLSPNQSFKRFTVGLGILTYFAMYTNPILMAWDPCCVVMKLIKRILFHVILQ